MALVGTETLQVLGVDGKGQPAATTQTATVSQIASLGAPILSGAVYNTVATASPFTLAANVVGGASDMNIGLTAVLAAGGAVTLPTAASVLALIPNAIVGNGYNMRILNKSTGAFAWTVTTNTGWTLNGTMTIAQNTFRDFIVTVTGAGTLTLQECGTGTDS